MLNAMKISQNSKSNFFVAAMLWFGTIYSVPQVVFLLPLLYLYVQKSGRLAYSRNDFLVIIFITIFSLLNYIYGSFAFVDFVGNRSPYFVIYPLCYLLARQLNLQIFFFVACLVAFECLFVFLEVAAGINTPFTSHSLFRSGMTLESLYFFRPFGLSDGINSMGAKLVCAIVITDYLVEEKKYQTILRVVLLAALVINFSRTALLAVVFHYLIYFFQGRRLVWFFFGGGGLLLLAALYEGTSGGFLDAAFDQLNRGKSDDLDYSFRDVIWGEVWSFILENPIFGNGSSKVFTWINEYGAWEHAHNSFLHVVSANGIVISSMLIGWLFVSLTRRTWKLVFPLVIFSLGQYGIFWSISFMDLVFLGFIFSLRKMGEKGFSYDIAKN